jgi:ribosome maturation factor RimP
VRPFFVPAGLEQELSSRTLTKLLQPLVEDLGYEFVGLEYASSPKHGVLRIYIDRESGVGLDDCSLVSREVAALLDVEDPISGHYNLEISSPGLDRPLFTWEQFAQFTGEEAQVSLFAPEEGRRKFKGRILGADADKLVIEQDGAEIALNFNNIAKARLVPDYDRLLSGQGQAK